MLLCYRQNAVERIDHVQNASDKNANADKIPLT